MTVVVHGIAHCDTVKRARAWLEGRGVVHDFHDFRKAGLPPGLKAGFDEGRRAELAR